jgi:CHAT domain-containing protein
VHGALTARNRRPPRESPEQRGQRIAGADDDLAAAGAELAALVLEPAGEALAGRRLLIVPDGALHYVPFGALPVPGGDGARLVEQFEIAELPAASVLPALARRGDRARNRSVAILADPVFSADDPRVTHERPGATPPPAGHEFSRLRFSRAEAEAVAALAHDGEPLIALDFNASEITALGPRIGEAGLVHFATHGVLNSHHPELSSLVLSLVGPRGEPVDGFLRLHEIYNMSLSADLVVLSACETALGTYVRGEGLVGLTRGFLYAGARRVIASLWRVDDRATAELMKRFYAALLVDGVAAPAALRAAQRSMQQDPRWSAPYYWAGFVVQGDL